MSTIEDITLLLKALRFSAEKHRDQRRKDIEASPYINHPIQVAETLWEIGGVRDVHIIAAALLHDTLEDTDTHPEEILHLCGADILGLVQEVTDDKKLSKVQRKRLQIQLAPHKSAAAKQIKLADKACNVYDITHSPPQHWPFRRRRGYLRWTEQVVAGLRGVNPLLENHYDAIMAQAKQKLSLEKQANRQALKAGDRVRHPKRPHWGIGQIIECTPDQRLRVFFVGAGHKRLKLAKTRLIKLDRKQATHSLLDNLKKPVQGKILNYKTMPELVEIFLNTYPEGFYTPQYINQQRLRKVQAYEYMKNLLNQRVFVQFLDEGNYSEISQRVLEVIDRSLLIEVAEHRILQQILQNADYQQLFIDNLYRLLFDVSDIEQRFNAFSDCLRILGIGYWTIATYFLFVTYPKTDMLFNPSVTLPSADVCAFELAYNQQPNWQTYQRLLRFANYLKQTLSDMKPRDMFDVYTFMATI